MSPSNKLKDYENEASLNPGDRWRTSIKKYSESDEPDLYKNSQSEIKDREQEAKKPQRIEDYNGNSKRSRGKFAGKGPLMAILGGLSISLIVVSLIGSMMSGILVNIKEVLFNDHHSNSARTNKVFRDATHASQFTKGKCVGTIKILCKFSSVSDRQIKKFERAGFKVEVNSDKKSVIPGRKQILRYVFPDGTVANSAREFIEIANSTPERARVVRYATLGKTAYFLNTKFDKVLKNLKISGKSKILIGNNKEENDNNVNKNTNGVDSKGLTDQEVKDKVKESVKEDTKNKLNDHMGKISSKLGGGKSNWLIAPVVLGCGAYDMSRMITAYAKKYHIEQMAKYAMIFLNTADRIKDQGDITPEQVTYIGDLLTEADNRKKIPDINDEDTLIDNPSYGKTATDAQAYKIAAHGDGSPLTPEAQKFRSNGYRDGEKTSWLGSLDNVTSSIETTTGLLSPQNLLPTPTIALGSRTLDFAIKYAQSGFNINDTITRMQADVLKFKGDGRESLRWLCRKADDLAVIAYVTFCSIQAVNAATVGVGNPESGVGWLSILSCAVAADCYVKEKISVGTNCSDIVKWVGERAITLADNLGVTEWILKYVQAGIVGSFLKGTDVGNALGAGVAFMGEKTANGYGLRPAKDLKETKDFIASTNKDIEMDIKIAFKDAQSTPFDLANPFSFASTALRSAGMYYDKKAPLFSGIVSLFGMVPKSLAVSETAKAYYNQPVQTPDSRYTCNDFELLSIGINNADKFCNTIGITPELELQRGRDQALQSYPLIEETIKYMTNDQPENEKGGGTKDDSFCDLPSFPGTYESDDCDKHVEASIKRSINDDGSTVEGSQYSKYIKYCTEEREWPWGTFAEDIESAQSTRDIDWYSGEQCLSDSKMMQNFRTYYNLCTQLATMDDTPSCYEETVMASMVTQNGSACDLLNNQNIVFVIEGTKIGLKKICETGKATNSCGQEFTINPQLINTITTLSSKYKIWLNNFGFIEDRFSCDSGQHPKGNSIDLNGIEIIGGGGRAGGPDWGGITFSDPRQVEIIESYASDWLSTLPPDRGGVGQKGCGNFSPTFPVGSINVGGAAFFADSCDHLHIDIRNRGNLNAL